jgi:hypothetical protein
LISCATCHLAELTAIPRPPDGAEEVPAMLSRLLEAHEAIMIQTRAGARRTAELGDPRSAVTCHRTRELCLVSLSGAHGVA